MEENSSGTRHQMPFQDQRLPTNQTLKYDCSTSRAATVGDNAVVALFCSVGELEYWSRPFGRWCQRSKQNRDYCQKANLEIRLSQLTNRQFSMVVDGGANRWGQCQNSELRQVSIFKQNEGDQNCGGGVRSTVQQT